MGAADFVGVNGAGTENFATSRATALGLVMRTATFVEDFKEGLEFLPVEGRLNVFLIHTREKNAAGEEKMTHEDWNEFERHIVEAFEQVP